jgi:hypothetical protein
MATIDPGEAGEIKGHDHSRESLQVIRRFCLTVSFFAVWAMARQQPDPMLHFGATLRAASVVCAVVAVFGRARVGDQPYRFPNAAPRTLQ